MLNGNQYAIDAMAWITQNYPMYADGYSIRSLHWEYNLCGGTPAEIAAKAEGLCREEGNVLTADMEEFAERVHPPAGYAYITIQNDTERVGFNVPVEVFQKDEAA